jgi:hypothetical protein
MLASELVVGASVTWADRLTAYSTLALAVITALLVVAATTAAVFSKRIIDADFATSAKELEATREATRAAQAAAELQLEASRRPLLIDVAPDGPIYVDMGVSRSETRIVGGPLIAAGQEQAVSRFRGGLKVGVDPRQVFVGQTPGRLHVMVPLRNVGYGLAVIDSVDIRATGAATRKMMDVEMQRERVPPNETTRILCTNEVIIGEQQPDSEIYELAVPYRDFAGGQLTVALVRLQHVQDDEWRLHDVRQVEPNKLDPRLAFSD